MRRREVPSTRRREIAADVRANVDAAARAAVATVAVLVALTLIRVPTFNTIDTFDRHTGVATWSWDIWRLWRFGGDARTDTLFEATIYSTAFILLPTLAFVIWSRPWRLLQHTRRRRAHPTTA
jgi:hypothetical protein